MKLAPTIAALAALGIAWPALAQIAIGPLPESELPEMAKEIQKKNFNCRQARSGEHIGEDAYGWVFRIVCDHATFRVTMRPDVTFDVRPWGD